MQILVTFQSSLLCILMMNLYKPCVALFHYDVLKPHQLNLVVYATTSELCTQHERFKGPLHTTDLGQTFPWVAI